MALLFSKAVPSQHDEIYDLMLAAFTPYVQQIDEQNTAGPYPWLNVAIKGGNVYVGMDGHSIVGFICTVRDHNHLIIDQLGVNPARQGQGVGSWLIGELEQVAIGDGVTALVLQTAEMMDHLLRLYARHGFVETSRMLPEHGDDTFKRVHMRKQL